jgi:hypothetical protein
MTTNNERFDMIHTAHNDAAIHTVTNLSFLNLESIDIVERTGGIDVDNAGRSYSNEEYINYKNLMWVIMNHIAYYGTANIVSAVTGDSIDFHSPSAAWSEIRITLPSDDPESYGTVFTITKKEELE